MNRVKSGAALGAAAIALLCGGNAFASSHREAPFITSLPKADGTDFYMFNSYESGREGYVTLIADYQPLQEPGAAPNFYMLDEQVVYDINIDNDGSGKPGITFSFRFGSNRRDIGLGIDGSAPVSIPLINAGVIKDKNDPTLNVVELYNLSVFRGGAANRPDAGTITNKATGEAFFIKPIDNIGKKSIPQYEKYARQHIYDIAIPGCADGRVFVGQRKDPFSVNVAELFDLANVNVLGPADQHKDDLAKANVTSFILEVPAACLGGVKHVIGGWTTASMPRSRIGTQPWLSKDDQAGTDPNDLVQVSRVGMPLVNEVVIGLKDKDRFNNSQPKDDAQFLTYVTNPTFPALVAYLFKDAGVVAPHAPRKDLVTVFLTGIPGVNANGATAEELRLNTSTPPVAASKQNNLGVIGGDSAGFPNGRRPGDDVVDVTLRVAMGKLLPKDAAPSGQLPLVDGAYVDAHRFDEAFPYLRAPLTKSPKDNSGNGPAQDTGK